MKHFLSRNWYRFTIATASLLFSFGFLIWAVKNNPVKAGEPNGDKHPAEPKGQLLVVGKDVYRIAWNQYTDKYEYYRELTIK